MLRWAETLSGIARTGLGFTQSLYEQERFEEVLKVAADIRAAAIDEAESEVLFDEWLSTVGEGVAGYVTPKVAVAAVVGNDRGEILLTQRADSGWWLYPVGWADVGYSPSEIAMKEVLEETGIECEPVSLIAVLDGLRLGFARVPMYSIVFHCRMTGGELKGHPLETSAVGFFAATRCRSRSRARTAGSISRSVPSTARRSRRGTTRPAIPTWRGEAERRRDRSGSYDVSWSIEERDDRHLAVRAFPRVADRLVVDESAAIGRERERRRSTRLASRAGSISSPYAGNASSPSQSPESGRTSLPSRSACGSTPCVSCVTTDSQMS